jgi:hypothetical protein
VKFLETLNMLVVSQVLQNEQIGTGSNASDWYFDVTQFTSQPGHQAILVCVFCVISHSH